MSEKFSPKEVQLNIRSSLCDLSPAGLPDGDAENTEISAKGYIRYASDGATLISYEEDSEGGRIYSNIRICGRKVTVARRGAIESSMVFDEGVIHKSRYSMPPYEMDMEIFTEKIRQTVGFGEIQLKLIYKMKVGGSLRHCIFILTSKEIN